MSKTASLLIVLSISVLVLVLGKNLIIPFVFALLIWLLMRKFRDLLDYLPLFQKWIPRWVKTILSSFLFISIFFFLGSLVKNNLIDLIQSVENNPGNFDKILKQLSDIFPFDFNTIKNDTEISQTITKSFTFVFNSLGQLVQQAMVILLYVIFILLEESSFSLKLEALVKKEHNLIETKKIFYKIEASVTNYVGLKTLIASIASGISYIILYFTGIESPFFWALVIFVMNFIPTIGALVGTLFPTAFAFLQFGELGPGMIILTLVGSTQLLVGNFLEPRLMGNSLNVSPLVTVLALAFWGTIWGITGMFLSVPITVIMVIVFSHFPKTRSIAILLSEKGNIEAK
jgi:predicted PurR-regulated permease PerM